MSNTYSIIEVEPEWVVEPEDMGTKAKFWFRIPSSSTEWLFKSPRENTGEHWAEKITASVADVLDIPHATVYLAKFQDQRGSASRSFVPDDHELWHGNQIMEWTVAEYDPNIRYGQSDHSFDNIWMSFERVFKEPDAVRRSRKEFAGYMVLDAVIGNTDRHHENWGLLRRQVAGQWEGRLAPSFDHASSLGRELLDDRRSLLMQEKRVDWYSARGRGGIYWGRQEMLLSPFDLVRRAAQAHPSYFAEPLARLPELRRSVATEILDQVPADWMSTPAREFAVQLMTHNRNQLLELG